MSTLWVVHTLENLTLGFFSIKSNDLVTVKHIILCIFSAQGICDSANDMTIHQSIISLALNWCIICSWCGMEKLGVLQIQYLLKYCQWAKENEGSKLLQFIPYLFLGVSADENCLSNHPQLLSWGNWCYSLAVRESPSN